MDLRPNSTIEQEIWDDHTAWSELADGLKRARTRARAVVLVLTVIGAVLQTVAGTYHSVDASRVAGYAGTVALALVPVITAAWLKPDRTKKWLRARSISEGIKSEFHVYRAQASPYDGSNPLSLLVKKTHAIADYGDDMQALRAAVEPSGKKFPDIDPSTYIEQRVRRQINQYYIPKARLNARLAQQFRTVEIVLSIATAVLSALATYTTSAGAAMNANVAFPLGPWVAVLTTLGGTIAAFVAAGRYDFQATTFFATAANLKDLIYCWELSAQEAAARSPEWSAFVQNCEATISAENRDWMAKLDDTSKSGSVIPAQKEAQTTTRP